MERNNFNVNLLKKIKKQSNEEISILEIGTVFFEHLKRYLNPNSSYISFESNDKKFLEFSEKFEGVHITDKKEDLLNKSFDYIVMNFDPDYFSIDKIEEALNLVKELDYKELNIFLVSRKAYLNLNDLLEIAQKNNFKIETEERYHYFNIFISHTKTKEVTEETKEPEVEISIEKKINEV